MTYGQQMRRVVLPQALRVIIPPTGNEFIAMMKDTALVSFLGVASPAPRSSGGPAASARADFKPLEALFVAAGIYWALTAIFTFFQSRLEKRLSQGLCPEGCSDAPPRDEAGRAAEQAPA